MSTVTMAAIHIGLLQQQTSKTSVFVWFGKIRHYTEQDDDMMNFCVAIEEQEQKQFLYVL